MKLAWIPHLGCIGVNKKIASGICSDDSVTVSFLAAVAKKQNFVVGLLLFLAIEKK